jgi:hypothetical protein
MTVGAELTDTRDRLIDFDDSGKDGDIV